jgi:hypothetical protein
MISGDIKEDDKKNDAGYLRMITREKMTSFRIDGQKNLFKSG